MLILTNLIGAQDSIRIANTETELNGSDAFESDSAESALDTTESFSVDAANQWLNRVLDAKKRKSKPEPAQIIIDRVRPIYVKAPTNIKYEVDDRYEVYEVNVTDSNRMSTKKYKGEIRVLHPFKWPYSTQKPKTGDVLFYQTSGRKLLPGYVLLNKSTRRTEISLQKLVGASAGLEARMDYGLGNATKIPGLFAYAEWGMQIKDYPANPLSVARTYFFSWFGVGLAKRVQLLPILELRPYVGFGGELSQDRYWGNYTAPYFRAGANLHVTFFRNFQFVSGLRFTSFGNARKDSIDTGYSWNRLYPGRMGFSGSAGIKYCF